MRNRNGPVPNGVSVLTCTNRPECMNNLFRNYGRQHYRNKELIVILNHHSMKLADYIRAAKPYPNVRIYQLPDHISLGKCLNYAVRLSKFGTVAKFDDDDYYAPHYLTDSMRTMRRTKADIVGKRAHYMYLNGRRLLLLRYYHMENKYAPIVQGATLLVKRRVFQRVAFPDLRRGECVKFCSDCLAKGYRIYSGNRYNFVAVRRANSKNHTWIVSDKQLLAGKVRVMKPANVRSFVSKY